MEGLFCQRLCPDEIFRFVAKERFVGKEPVSVEYEAVDSPSRMKPKPCDSRSRCTETQSVAAGFWLEAGVLNDAGIVLTR